MWIIIAIIAHLILIEKGEKRAVSGKSKKEMQEGLPSNLRSIKFSRPSFVVPVLVDWLPIYLHTSDGVTVMGSLFER